MRKPSRAERAEWAARLKASGFEDLEVGTGELLSNRGTIEDRPDRPGLLERRHARAAYSARAMDFLRSHTFRPLRIVTHKGSAANLVVGIDQQRRIWSMHCEGTWQRVIAERVRMPYQQVRGVITALQAIAATGGAGGEGGKAACATHRAKMRNLRVLVRRSDPMMLMSMALAISSAYPTTRTRGRSSTSASASWGATSSASTRATR